MDPRNIEAEDLLCDDSFQRYCRGEDESDRLLWEAWIREHPDKGAVIARAKRLFDLLNVGQGNRLEQLASLKDAVDRQTQFKENIFRKTTVLKPGRVIKFNRKLLVRYAAGIIVLVSLSMLAYIKYGKKTAGQPHFYEYYTAAHGHKTIMLPDGSIVMLNENSHLSIHKDFDGQHRQVSITGEAYFDIKHDAGHPFLVNTQQYRIRVLGTSFNVRSYPAGDSTETTLLTGNIEIIRNTGADPGGRIVLNPNQKFILKASAGIKIQPGSLLSLSRGKVVSPHVDTSTHRLMETSWARSKMEINDKSFDEIAEKLQSWYGIKIRFADAAVKSYRYTATFDDETIFNALQYLQQSYPFTYAIEDDCIVIAKS